MKVSRIAAFLSTLVISGADAARFKGRSPYKIEGQEERRLQDFSFSMPPTDESLVDARDIAELLKEEGIEEGSISEITTALRGEGPMMGGHSREKCIAIVDKIFYRLSGHLGGLGHLIKKKFCGTDPGDTTSTTTTSTTTTDPGDTTTTTSTTTTPEDTTSTTTTTTTPEDTTSTTTTTTDPGDTTSTTTTTTTDPGDTTSTTTTTTACPEPGDGCETAYAYDATNPAQATCFTESPILAGNWGWSNGQYGSSGTDVTLQLWAAVGNAAGGCTPPRVPPKAEILVGTVTFNYIAQTVTYLLVVPNLYLEEVQVWVGDDYLPTNGGGYITAPGQYNYKADCLLPFDVTGYTFTNVDAFDGNVYVAAHATVCGDYPEEPEG